MNPTTYTMPGGIKRDRDGSLMTLISFLLVFSSEVLARIRLSLRSLCCSPEEELRARICLGGLWRWVREKCARNVPIHGHLLLLQDLHRQLLCQEDE